MHRCKSWCVWCIWWWFIFKIHRESARPCFQPTTFFIQTVPIVHKIAFQFLWRFVHDTIRANASTEPFCTRIFVFHLERWMRNGRLWSLHVCIFRSCGIADSLLSRNTTKSQNGDLWEFCSISSVPSDNKDHSRIVINHNQSLILFIALFCFSLQLFNS